MSKTLLLSKVRRAWKRGILSTIPELPLGVNGAALKAWDEKVGFLETLDGVKDGDSTLKAFLDLSIESVEFFLGMTSASGKDESLGQSWGVEGYAIPNKRKQTELQSSILVRRLVAT